MENTLQVSWKLVQNSQKSRIFEVVDCWRRAELVEGGVHILFRCIWTPFCFLCGLSLLHRTTLVSLYPGFFSNYSHISLSKLRIVILKWCWFDYIFYFIANRKTLIVLIAPKQIIFILSIFHNIMIMTSLPAPYGGAWGWSCARCSSRAPACPGIWGGAKIFFSCPPSNSCFYPPLDLL